MLAAAVYTGAFAAFVKIEKKFDYPVYKNQKPNRKKQEQKRVDEHSRYFVDQATYRIHTLLAFTRAV